MSSKSDSPEEDNERSATSSTGSAPYSGAVPDTSKPKADIKTSTTWEPLNQIIPEISLRAQMLQPVSLVVSPPREMNTKSDQKQLVDTDKQSAALSAEQQLAEGEFDAPLSSVTSSDMEYISPDASAAEDRISLAPSVASSDAFAFQMEEQYRSLPVLPLETEDIDLDRLYSRISSALLEATADTFMSGGVTEQWVAHTDSSIRGILFTLLHCVSQAIVNMIIKQLVDIPKTKLAFYAAFGLLVGHMPEGFALENPLAERQLQIPLVLRSMASLMSLMLKAEALSYIAVSDMAIMFTIVPIGVMIVSWYFLDEKIHFQQVVAILLCTSGIVIVMRPRFLFAQSSNTKDIDRLKGFLYALGSALSLVALVIILRIMGKRSTHFIGFNSGLTRTTLAMSFTIMMGDFRDIFTTRYLGTLVMVGKINFCAIFFLSKALQRESAATVSIVKFCGDIVFSIVVQILFTGDYPDVLSVVGTTLVLGSFATIASRKAARWYAENFLYEYHRRLAWVRNMRLHSGAIVR